MRLFGGKNKQSETEHEGTATRSPDSFERAFERFEEVRTATARAAREMRAAAEKLGATQEPSSDRGQIVTQLLESLAERAERLDAEARQLAEVLGRAAGVLSMLEPSQHPPSGGPTSPSEASAPPTPVSTRRRRNGRASQPASEGVRLIATQMAVAGSSREEIEARLRSEFNVEDADAVLDKILGSVP